MNRTEMILKIDEQRMRLILILQEKLIQAWITYFFSPSSKRNGSNDSGAFILITTQKEYEWFDEFLICVLEVVHVLR